MPMAQGFRARSPRIPPPGPPEKTPSWDRATPGALGNHERHWSDAVRRASSCARHCMIPRRTPITSIGSAEKPLFPGLGSSAIAHDELVASAGVGTFDVPERDFPGNRAPACWKFVCRPKRKICAPDKSGALPATTTPLTASVISSNGAPKARRPWPPASPRSRPPNSPPRPAPRRCAGRAWPAAARSSRRHAPSGSPSPRR